MDPRGQPDGAGEAGLAGVVQGPVLVGPDQVRVGVAAAREAGLATLFAAAWWFGQDELGGVDHGQGFGVGKGHGASVRPPGDACLTRLAGRRSSGSSVRVVAAGQCGTVSVCSRPGPTPTPQIRVPDISSSART